MESIFKPLGVAMALILPFFNLPLIMRMIERKSSADISLVWLYGVWICTILMSPSAITSHDIVFKTFNIMNIILFSGVVVTVIKYRKKP